MPLQNFVDRVGPVIASAWLNAVDTLKFTIFADSTTKAQARAALTSDASFTVSTAATGGARLLQANYNQYLADSDSYKITAAEIAAGVTPTNYAFLPGDIRRYGAVGDGATNCSPAIQAACNQCTQNGVAVVIPGCASFYRCNTAITLNGPCKIKGDGTQPSLHFYAVDGFLLPVGIEFLNISGLELFSVDGAGTPDPMNRSGIATQGTNANNTNFLTIDQMMFRGWQRCIDLRYTWYSKFTKIYTINCSICISMFGRCVTNFVSDSHLISAGTASIQTTKDGAIQGEGLHVVNTLLASGTYGLISDGFLSLHIDNCEVDQITDTAIDLTNVVSFGVSNSWLFAANFGVRFRDLGVTVDQQASVQGCRIEVTASNGRSIEVGSNNFGIAISGGALICGAAGNSRCFASSVTATTISITGVNLINPSANRSILVGGTSFRHAGLVGNVTIDYSNPDQFTGTLTQCTTAPTAPIIYTEVGDMVTLQIPALNAVSANTNAPTITGMPVEIRPLTQQYVSGHIIDNGVSVAGFMEINTSGVIGLRIASGGAFTAANTKGTNPYTICYRRF